MSAPETPAVTTVEQLIQAHYDLSTKVQEQTDAINGLGQNIQWIIDNVQGIFQMFSNPAFMQMMPQMMGGMPSDYSTGPEDNATASGPAE